MYCTRACKEVAVTQFKSVDVVGAGMMGSGAAGYNGGKAGRGWCGYENGKRA